MLTDRLSDLHGRLRRIAGLVQARGCLSIFTKRQLDESWKRMATAEYWFVPKGADGKPRIGNVDLAPLVLPALEQDFVLDGVGDRLMAWKRKSR
jgi:hypothetical protein